jgi:hypothetical protein
MYKGPHTDSFPPLPFASARNNFCFPLLRLSPINFQKGKATHTHTNRQSTDVLSWKWKQCRCFYMYVWLVLRHSSGKRWKCIERLSGPGRRSGRIDSEEPSCWRYKWKDIKGARRGSPAVAAATGPFQSTKNKLLGDVCSEREWDAVRCLHYTTYAHTHIYKRLRKYETFPLSTPAIFLCVSGRTRVTSCCCATLSSVAYILLECDERRPKHIPIANSINICATHSTI